MLRVGESPAEIDFARQQPEAVRGVQRRDRPVNWEALSMAVDHGTREVSQLKRAQLKHQMLKAVRRNGIESLDPRLRYNYCRARLTLGDFSDYWGWEFRDAGANGENWSAHLYWEETWLPKWGGGGCNRILVLGEQGIGDAVFIASVLPEAMIRVREVIFECDDRLHALLERSLPGLKCRSERKFEDRREDYGTIDAFIPSFELLRMFRRDRRAFPGLAYLKPPPNRLAEVEKYRGRVGISWTARQGSIEPMDLGIDQPLSVQYKHFHREVEQPGIDLWHDIEGIVALCSVLEKIVCVPTSVHHLAGAAGAKVEIIVPEVRNAEAENLSPWDYSTAYNGGKLLWYPDARVFENVAAWKAAVRAK
jgi:hypothetical protein